MLPEGPGGAHTCNLGARPARRAFGLNAPTRKGGIVAFKFIVIAPTRSALAGGEAIHGMVGAGICKSTKTYNFVRCLSAEWRTVAGARGIENTTFG